MVQPPVNNTPNPYGNLNGAALELAQRLEADRLHYLNTPNAANDRYKNTTNSDTDLNLRLHNYANNRTYSPEVLDEVGVWWAGGGAGAAYAYYAPTPKPYADNHDVANFLFHHPANHAYNGHAYKNGPKTT